MQSIVFSWGGILHGIFDSYESDIFGRGVPDRKMDIDDGWCSICNNSICGLGNELFDEKDYTVMKEEVNA